MNRPANRSSRGFTLLEVMIVTTIVAILSLLALVAVGRIKERAARTVILNNLRQLYDAKEFYFSETGSSQTANLASLQAKGFISARVNEMLSNPRSYEAALGWHYLRIAKPGEPVLAYKGVMSTDGKPTGEALYYPDEPAAVSARNSPPVQPTGPTVASVRLAPGITGATPLSASGAQASGVPVGTQLVGLYLAGSDKNQLDGVDPSRLPRVGHDYTQVGTSGYQYFQGSGVFSQLMPHMADNLRPLRPSERNAWDGGIAVFSDGSVARLDKVCNGNSAGGEKDYAYFSVLNGVNSNQGMALISGTAQPGQSVQVSHGGSTVGTVTADAQGHWTMAGPAALAGASSSLTVIPVSSQP